MMKDYLISMFIDDELSLDDKLSFVETVHTDHSFKEETSGLLNQEKLIRSEVVDRIPSIQVREQRKPIFSTWRPAGIFASALAAALILLFFAWPAQQQLSEPYRFVIYQPEAKQVQITGSFIDWRRLPLRKVGTSGYWEVTLDLPAGEHRFSYILEGGRRLVDPTILAREKDDFGGENSILEVNLQV